MDEQSILSVLSCQRYLTVIEISKITKQPVLACQQILIRLQHAGQIQERHFAGRDYFRSNHTEQETALGATAASYLANRKAAVKLGDARTCYHHLGGKAGVELFKLLITQQFVKVTGMDRYALTDAGRQQLSQFLKRPVQQFSVATCIDFSERQPHLAGKLGNDVFRGLVDAHILALGNGRIVNVNRPLDQWIKEIL
ncbi:hypothetical protein [Lentilactobacillus kisonensis]|uniref:Transcriptional regulator n=2 Tax=Lentilactobacillus kisonensis TaxID=481722 RepID=H1LIG7_9LACO|nr:hypothetical protein [Lentilactobacillus kisonensis]EHO49757.1 hypothetical protein HMPREF9104_02408 [Lentilactobacillus kisonensis F0435]KRL22393.1 hypothetical protein FC98_GL002527 [Lentilactobacillus kisonensis DSM 19906 = JCM 15041]